MHALAFFQPGNDYLSSTILASLDNQLLRQFSLLVDIQLIVQKWFQALELLLRRGDELHLATLGALETLKDFKCGLESTSPSDRRWMEVVRVKGRTMTGALSRFLKAADNIQVCTNYSASNFD